MRMCVRGGRVPTESSAWQMAKGRRRACHSSVKESEIVRMSGRAKHGGEGGEKPIKIQCALLTDGDTL